MLISGVNTSLPAHPSLRQMMMYRRTETCLYVWQVFNEPSSVGDHLSLLNVSYVGEKYNALCSFGDYKRMYLLQFSIYNYYFLAIFIAQLSSAVVTSAL